MRFRTLFLAAPLSFSLSGCLGSQGGCSGYTTIPFPGYQGSYTATYTPFNGSPSTFTFTVGNTGLISGTATTPGGTGSLTGEASRVQGCLTSVEAVAELRYRVGSGVEQYLTGTKDDKTDFNGTYAGRLFANGFVNSSGTLTIVRV